MVHMGSLVLKTRLAFLLRLQLGQSSRDHQLGMLQLLVLLVDLLWRHALL